MLSALNLLLVIGLQNPQNPTTSSLLQGQDRDQNQTKMLLAPGTTAPDFTVEKWGGGDLKLSNTKGKIVVLDFWSTPTTASQASLPHNEKLYKAAKDQGLEIYEVAVWDDRDAYETWMKANSPMYTLNFGFDPTPKSEDNIAKRLYRVSDLPTTYVIDKDGKVVDAFVGYHEGDTRLEEALKKLGLNID